VVEIEKEKEKKCIMFLNFIVLPGPRKKVHYFLKFYSAPWSKRKKKKCIMFLNFIVLPGQKKSALCS